MARERLFLFDTTLRARSRAGAMRPGFARNGERRARTRQEMPSRRLQG
jgi:hypothetical protein